MIISGTITLSWLIDENKPPKIVIIIIKLDIQFNELSSGVANGLNLSSKPRKMEFNINIKKPLFW